MSDAIEKIKQQQAKRRAEVERDYRALVASVAAGGKIPTAEKIDQILNDARKDTDQLEADVKLVNRRKALREKIAHAEKEANRLGEIAEAIAIEKQKLAVAEETYRRAIGPLIGERERIVSLQADASNARRELRDLADDESIDELSNLEKQLQTASHARVDATKNLVRIQSAEPLKQPGFKEPTFQDREEWQGMVERAQSRVDAAKQQEVDIVSRQDALIESSLAGD